MLRHGRNTYALYNENTSEKKKDRKEVVSVRVRTTPAMRWFFCVQVEDLRAS